MNVKIQIENSFEVSSDDPLFIRCHLLKNSVGQVVLVKITTSFIYVYDFLKNVSSKPIDLQAEISASCIAFEYFLVVATSKKKVHIYSVKDFSLCLVFDFDVFSIPYKIHFSTDCIFLESVDNSIRFIDINSHNQRDFKTTQFIFQCPFLYKNTFFTVGLKLIRQTILIILYNLESNNITFSQHVNFHGLPKNLEILLHDHYILTFIIVEDKLVCYSIDIEALICTPMMINDKTYDFSQFVCIHSNFKDLNCFGHYIFKGNKINAILSFDIDSRIIRSREITAEVSLTQPSYSEASYRYLLIGENVGKHFITRIHENFQKIELAYKVSRPVLLKKLKGSGANYLYGKSISNALHFQNMSIQLNIINLFDISPKGYFCILA